MNFAVYSKEGCPYCERINLEAAMEPSTMNVQECEDLVKKELQEKLVPTQKDGFPWEGTQLTVVI